VPSATPFKQRVLRGPARDSLAAVVTEDVIR